jgi:ubiquinone/menaquinone biosynthesis C-methylase UbiE
LGDIHSRKNIDFYDQRAAQYDDLHIFKRENRVHYKKIKKVFEMLELKPGDRVIEIGVGTGIHAQWLTSRVDVHFAGIDVSAGMIRQARHRLSNNKHVDCLVCNAESLPFKDKTFDAAYCSGSLHHITNPEITVGEMARVLKDNGRIVIMEPNRYFPKNLFHALTNPIERNVLKMTLTNLRTWAEKNHMKEIHTSYFIFTPPIPKSFIPMYDKVDNFMEGIPLFNRLSIMLYLSARK